MKLQNIILMYQITDPDYIDCNPRMITTHSGPCVFLCENCIIADWNLRWPTVNTRTLHSLHIFTISRCVTNMSVYLSVYTWYLCEKPVLFLLSYQLHRHNCAFPSCIFFFFLVGMLCSISVCVRLTVLLHRKQCMRHNLTYYFTYVLEGKWNTEVQRYSQSMEAGRSDGGFKPWFDGNVVQCQHAACYRYL